MLNDQNFGKDLDGKNFFLTLALPMFLTLMHLIMHVIVQSSYGSDTSSWFNMIFLPLALILMAIGFIYLFQFLKSKNWKPFSLMAICFLNTIIVLIIYFAQS